MAPVVHGLEEAYAGQIGFVYLDVDDPAVTPLEVQLGFRAQPHLLLLYADGSVAKQWVGITAEEDLMAAMDQLVAGEEVP